MIAVIATLVFPGTSLVFGWHTGRAVGLSRAPLRRMLLDDAIVFVVPGAGAWLLGRLPGPEQRSTAIRWDRGGSSSPCSAAPGSPISRSWHSGTAVGGRRTPWRSLRSSESLYGFFSAPHSRWPRASTRCAPADRSSLICTHNSARSQMAESFLRKLGGDRLEVASPGTEATSVHPLAIRVMAEKGFDLSACRSKSFHELLGRPWDYVITLCDDARERCPGVPERTRRLHWSLPDPSRATGTDDEILNTFRWVRDLIREHVADWISEEQHPKRSRLPVSVLVIILAAAALVAAVALGLRTFAAGLVVGFVTAAFLLMWFLWW